MKDVNAAGITPVFVFHSENHLIRMNQEEYPWSRNVTYVADPDKELYKATGAETSAMRVLMSFSAKQLFSFVFSAKFKMVGSHDFNKIVFEKQDE
jgi:hypothetical protein